MVSITIRCKIRISIFVTISVIAATIAAIAFTYHKSTVARKHHQFAHTADQLVTEMSFLVPDFFSLSSNRSMELWEEKYNRLGDYINGPEDEINNLKMNKIFTELKDFYQKITEENKLQDSLRSTNQNKSENQAQVFITKSFIAQFSAHSYELYSILRNTSIDAEKNAERADRISKQITLGSLILLALIIFSLFYVIRTDILKRISLLGDDLRIIEQGDLSHRASVTSTDEIGAFSEQFNEMTRKFKISQSTLREEIEERKKTSLEIKHVRSRIEEILTSVQKVAIGDLTTEFKLTGKHDDFDALSTAISMMVDDLREAYNQQENLIETLNEAMKHIAAQNENLESIVKERTYKLEQSNKELEQFAYVASHDLQEPLRVVVNYLQFIESRYQDKLDDKGRDFITRSVNATKRMQEMIKSLLMYSRIATRGKPFKKCDTNVIIKDVLSDLDLTLQKHDAVIHCSNLPEITADEAQISRLFQNLITNAIKFCDKKNPEITIAYYPENGRNVFSVKDNGIGIEERFFDQVFEIFQRLHNHKQYEGTGIGLSACKKIVERHGGRIWLESVSGKGTTVFFTLESSAI